MNVDIVSNKTPPLSAKDQSPTGNDILGRDTFLQLLVTQLRYQNPMNPMSNGEFIAQSAQFSALEQTRELNANVKALLEFQKSSSKTAALNLIGKNVVAQYSELSLSNGSPINLSYSLSEDANVIVTICDEHEKPVRTINVENQLAGDHNLVWDGLNDEGIRMIDGSYHYEISAADENGNDVSVSETISGIVDSLITLDGEQYISIGGLRVPLEAVKEVWANAED